MIRTFTRRGFASCLLATAALGSPFSFGSTNAAALTDLKSRFEYLSQHGNSNCSRQFTDSIAAMPETALLQGSCCSPMVLDRYSKQVNGLRKYRNIALIPDDPYNIAAGTAQKLMPYYKLQLGPAEQKVYDYAIANSNEKGPCCCKCWRWNMYGGLGKFLIREHHFTGEQLVEVWNLSDGCGGAEDQG